MISINISTGGKKESVKLTRFKSSMYPNLIRGIDKATTRLEARIKRNLSIGGTVDRRKGAPREKNPGRHLRVQDGTLRSSWTARKAKRVPGGVEGHVATPVVYSAIHEFGGQAGRGHSVRIPERPYVRPAINKERDAMVKDIMSEVLKPLRSVV